MLFTPLVTLAALSLSAASASVQEADPRPEFDGLADGLTLSSAPWRPGPSLELARAGLSAAALDGQVFAAGGAGLVGPRDDFEMYEAGLNRWRARSPLPVGLERFAMTEARGRIWVAGGYSATSEAEPSAQVWSYDPALDVWQEEPSLPGPKASFALLNVDDRLYAAGGEDGAPGLFVYDHDALEWSALPAPLETDRRGAAAVAVNGALWLTGGVRDGVATARVDVYDVAARTWRRGPDLPTPRAGHAAAVLNGAIHVFGGRSADLRRTLRDHWALDEGAGAWREEAAMPAPRTESAAATLDGAIWLIGGGAGAGFFAPFTAVDSVDVFTPEQP